MKQQILRYLFKRPEGKTCREIELSLGIGHSDCLNCLRELTAEHKIMIGGWKTEDDWGTMSAVFWFLTG